MGIVLIETPREVSTSRGTTIKTENGTAIPAVKSVDIHIAPDSAITANIQLHAAFRGHADATFYIVDPYSGEDKAVSKVVFADGSEWSAE